MYRVLVADDERWIRKGIVKMIDREGLGISEIYEADSVTAALEQFRLHQPDIVLSDVIFPAENGCDFCDQIIAIQPETRIVMISAFDNFEFARRSIKFRALDYLLKPVSKEQLNQVLSQCIGQLKARTEGPGGGREAFGQPACPAGAVPGQGRAGQGGALGQEAPAVEDGNDSEFQVRQVMEQIKAHLGDKYTLAAMAAECCLSEAYFSNLFKKVSGMSPMNYIVHMRMEKACELMTSTNWRMVRIAQSVGYYDYQYFAKVFKKVTGQTPGDYREKLQEEFGDD